MATLVPASVSPHIILTKLIKPSDLKAKHTMKSKRVSNVELNIMP